MNKKYTAEPYRIKMVEPIFETTKEERIELLKNAGYNPFSLASKNVYIDLLTDSGTGSMSQEQWGHMMTADEAYAGSKSFYKLEGVVKNITGYKYFIPAHQGRGAEQIVLPQLVTKKGMYFISNIHFDTTRAHVELAGARAIDCVIDECFNIELDHPFKGNFDLVRLEELILEKGSENIGGIIMTITNNSAGGQPVSFANMKAVKEISHKYGITLLIDGARYAENAFFIKEREEGFKDLSILEISRKTFDLADIFLMSAKKDGLVNMGGIIAIKDDELLYKKCQTYIVPYEGFPTYGGLSGRDMEALAQGLMEALDMRYLRHRVDQIRFLGDMLKEAGVPIQYPIGGHAVFVDCGKMAPHIAYDQFPALSVVNELYLEAGIRGVEIGSLLLGRDPDTHKNLKSPIEFMRLTIPRRLYTYSHLEIVGQAVIEVYKRRNELKGYVFEYESPMLRHFTSTFKPNIKETK
ncbi:tryptophanase [Mariniplasma anaerobium]|uniref:L-cysteine desulfhydrase n=1 Tax=Mariniplasma anaerobium TaxID=2735436 RepID=A0A7U9THU0_9MOLU|nr:tryptophanase [Mariniplasma anaerobium]BCR36771.1 L-cysteine desulfhydrase [Mariniplasma anaerobium]